jgi:hypothetical protein
MKRRKRSVGEVVEEGVRVAEAKEERVEERGPVPSEGWMGPAEREVAGLVLAFKALVLLFGAQAFTVTTNSLLPSLRGWLEIWDRWDAPHYLDIARDGYVTEGVASRWIVFYPLYPWLIRGAAILTRDYLTAAFLISGAASIAAGLLLYRLARLDESDEVARGAVFFLLIFPTAYFLHIGYTESLFLALALGAFLAARGGRWWVAGIVGLLAGMTRVNGLALVPALGFEVYAQWREGGRRWRWEWLWCAAPLAGFGLYLLLNQYVFGDPFEFLRAQETYWAKRLTWPWVGIQGAWRALWRREASEAQMVGAQELLFVALGLGCTIWAAVRARASYAVWMAANWLLWTSTKFILSVPRYTLVMFPIFILFARASQAHAVWRAVLVVWSLLFMGLFVTRFVQGYWGF